MTLIKNNIVERVLWLIEIYNTAAGEKMETIMLDLTELREVMTPEERYSVSVHVAAKTSDIPPELIDNSLTRQFGDNMEDKLAGIDLILEITDPENPAPRLN